VWLDPIDIQLGRLATLRVPGAAHIVSLGVVPFSYLRLKLYLRAHGLAAEFHDYDWRLPVAQLGSALAERVRARAARAWQIVAHSMGDWSPARAGTRGYRQRRAPGAAGDAALRLVRRRAGVRGTYRWCARWRGSPARHRREPGRGGLQHLSEPV